MKTNFIEKKLISVLIPCYNQGSFIDDAVESVLQQTYKNFEIIIVDAGSNDEFTKTKLSTYSKPNTKVIKSHDKLFPSAARNLAFGNSNGEFILTLDADDVLEESFMVKTLNNLMNDPKLGASSSKVVYFGYEEGFLDYMGGSLEDVLRNMGSHLTALIRRSAWSSIGGFDETFNDGFEDWEFWIRLTKAGWVINIIPEVLFYYRQKEFSRVTTLFQNQNIIIDKLKKKHMDVYQNPYKYLKNALLDQTKR